MTNPSSHTFGGSKTLIFPRFPWYFHRLQAHFHRFQLSDVGSHPPGPLPAWAERGNPGPGRENDGFYMVLPWKNEDLKSVSRQSLWIQWAQFFAYQIVFENWIRPSLGGWKWGRPSDLFFSVKSIGFSKWIATDLASNNARTVPNTLW